MANHHLSQDDRDFLEAFEACTYPADAFDHRAHVRLAYAYLAEHSVEAAMERLRGVLLTFLKHVGAPASRYHETITRAWILAVRHFMEQTAAASSADDFIQQNPDLLDAKIMLTHYSEKTLFSETARGRYVEPDLDPIPRYQP